MISVKLPDGKVKKFIPPKAAETILSSIGVGEGTLDNVEGVSFVGTDKLNAGEYTVSPTAGAGAGAAAGAGAGAAAVVVSKTFAPANGLMLDAHFMVKTRAMDELEGMVNNGRFVLVMSHRQSGKTTTAKYVARSIPGTIMLSFALYNSSRCVWESLLKQLHGLYPSRFAKPVGRCSAEDFMGAVRGQGQGMHLIIDEADVLLEHASDETLTEFLQAIRTLKQNAEMYRLYGVVLLGTHRLTKVLAARNRSVSPFTAENVVVPPRFEQADVVDLLGQFCTLHAIGGDLPEIASSIMAWTEGHVGLVGCCLHLLEEKLCSGKAGNDIRIGDWVAFADVSLSEFVWGGAVFDSIAYHLGTLAADQDGRMLLSLKRLMTQASCWKDDGDVGTELLSLGLVVEKAVGDRPALMISSPLMRALLLVRMKVPSVNVNPLGTQSTCLSV